MPCSQMISMNIRPPRATADKKVESVPNVKALIRNSWSRNMGCATRRSIIAKAIRLTVAPAISASTLGLVQPVGWPFAGRMPYVTATITSTRPSANVTLPHQSDDQDAGHDQVAEDHPQQVEAVSRHQRIELDAAEDVRHGDQDDGGIEGRQQNTERGIGQRDPLVAIGIHASSLQANC